MRIQPESSKDNMTASLASISFQIEPRNTTLQLINTNIGFLIQEVFVASCMSH